MRKLYPANAWRNYQDEIINCLHNTPHICFAILYGSGAENAPFHDVDIAVWADRVALPATHDLEFTFALAERLAQILPFPVDVRVINDAPLAFRYNVSKGIPLLVNDEPLFFDWLERTWDDWLDFKPVAMRYLQELV